MDIRPLLILLFVLFKFCSKKEAISMKIYELKTDSNLPHHYIISVAMHPATAGKKAGKYYLKYRPMYFHNNEIAKLRDVAIMIQDKLFPTSQAEALDIFGLKEKAMSFSMMKLAAKVNMCTLHHFSSEHEIILDEEWFCEFVNQANSIESIKEQLRDAEIKY
jgi:hypothetical protein